MVRIGIIITLLGLTGCAPYYQAVYEHPHHYHNEYGSPRILYVDPYRYRHERRHEHEHEHHER